MDKRYQFIVVALFMVAGIGMAQESSGGLEGRVVDSLGSPIPGVSITVTGSSLPGIQGTSTDENGYFRVPALPVGSYMIRINHIAYQDIIYQDVPVRLGKNNSLGEVRLNSQTIELAAVTISGSRPLIDATSTTTGANFEAGALELLPNDRNFRSIISLAPEANASYLGDETNISGSTGNENIYFIDGINVTEPVTAKTSTNLPYNFVREIEVKTGGYEAEYASALGGVANVITQSGGNDVHGQVFGFSTNSSLAAEKRRGILNDNMKNFVSYDIGMSIGGPILQDKLWYFTAYNPNYDDKDIEITNIGTFKDRKRSHLFAGKLTWQASSKTSLIASILGDPSTEELVSTSIFGVSGITNISNPDPLLCKLTTGGVNGSIQMRHIVGEKFFLEGYVSQFTRKDDNEPRTDRGKLEPLIIDYETQTVSGGSRFVETRHASRTTAQLSGLLFVGTHAVKAGLGFEDSGVDYFWGNPYGQDQPIRIERYSDSMYMVWFWRLKGKVHNRIPSIFLQDSWLATGRLRINAGLRLTNEYFEGADGKLAQRITGEYQPRLGIIYQLGEVGSQKLFGSYGRFYEQIPLFLSRGYHNPITTYIISYNLNPLTDPSGGDTLDFSSPILPEVVGLQGQHFDEFTLGYERRIGDEFRVSIRGVYRNLLQVVEDGYDTTNIAQGVVGGVVGNPGEGALSFLPKFTRQYTAMEVTFERSAQRGLNFLVSYVLSRTYGNYPGLYSSDYRIGNVNVSPFDTPDQILNSEGLLPNDRTHVLKFSGSYAFDFGLSAGTSFILQSGTPLNEFGPTILGAGAYTFLQPRGSLGRTPAIWDLNVRLTYDLSVVTKSYLKPKFIVDVFHLFSQRDPVDFDQVHYLAQDENGTPTVLNPNYGKALAYQQPMSVRLGMEINF